MSFDEKNILKTEDIDNVIIEVVRAEEDYHNVRDIVIKFPPGKGYDPETISLVDAGIINLSGQYEIDNLKNKDGKVVAPRVKLWMYGSIQETRRPKKEEQC